MTTATGLSPCCVTGHLHEGTPTGTVEKIADLDVYVSKPKDGSKAKTILFIADIFGWNTPNARLLADEYANAGFYVYVPDFFKGDNISHDMLQTIAPREPHKRSTLQVAADNASTMATFGPWAVRHREAVVKPLMDEFIKFLRTDPLTGKIGAVGFCWGGRYALVLAGEGSVDAAVANHPSMASEADFLSITKPTQINVGTNDIFLPNETVEQVKAALAEKKSDLPFEINVFQDAVHGFAVRGDISDAKEKENKEASANATLRWFNKYLV
ncbi:alpha/beta-hydrolase [Calocera cornea HHB12733]|uniref:Alpha/beta-hydrolase n=1 Tax=Calocera cornea HHB12733 TaxID=1353952 RepID=A0A165DHQ5_9BASI|nr:alpha/beta-hydrolase [Calocera cornea HHB12733]